MWYAVMFLIGLSSGLAIYWFIMVCASMKINPSVCDFCKASGLCYNLHTKGKLPEPKYIPPCPDLKRGVGSEK